MSIISTDDQKVMDKEVIYETIVILKSSITDEEVAKEIEKIKTAVSQKSGELLRIEDMGKKRLAYDVKKEKRGIFILLHFKGNRNTVFEVQRLFQLNEMIIKYITVKTTLSALQSKLAGGEAASSDANASGGEIKEDGQLQ